MLFVHETHEVAGGKMEEFEEAVRTLWRPLVEERGGVRLLWFWHLTHGTGAEVMPVIEADGRRIGDGTPGALTRRLQQAFQALARTEGDPLW